MLIRRRRSCFGSAVLFAGLLLAPAVAHAQATPAPWTPGPLPDAKPVVEAPKAGDAPAPFKATDHTTNVSLTAGGQLLTGNSNSLAGTVNGAFDMRRGQNGFGASLLGNYAQGATPGNFVVETAENIQGRLRYDRFLGERTSVFGIVTGRQDPFQGLVFRLNLDPGFKYLFIDEKKSTLWGELGYDFQYDIRDSDALVQLDPAGNPIPGAPLLSKTATDNSARLFAGFRQGFNDAVTLTTGLEYLQSVIASTRYRLNFNAVLAAKIVGGLSVGVGVSVRYDHDPLPGKRDTDTASTLSLIYAYSDLPKPPTCPCPAIPDNPVPIVVQVPVVTPVPTPEPPPASSNPPPTLVPAPSAPESPPATPSPTMNPAPSP